jgi:hypothetical protein
MLSFARSAVPGNRFPQCGEALFAGGFAEGNYKRLYKVGFSLKRLFFLPFLLTLFSF